MFLAAATVVTPASVQNGVSASAAAGRPAALDETHPSALVLGTGHVEDYQLGAGDKLRVIVYNEPQLSGEFQVAANGALAVPLIGDVAAAGRTPSSIAAEVQTKLGDGYLRDPRVSVEVLTYRPYYILGEVKTPGQYPYSSGLTVMNAIATAEGFTARSGRKTVFIRRAGSTEEKAYPLTPELRVSPGDTIRLGERYF
jgi:polysaccharide export outer membrane protein